MAWLLGLWANPLVRKIAIYLAVSLAILYGLYLWGNAQWRKGEQQGRVSVAIELEKKYREEWEAKSKQIEVAAATLAADRRTLDAQTTQLAQTRRQMQDALSATLKQISASREATDATVIALPADALDDALRGLSAELAAAK